MSYIGNAFGGLPFDQVQEKGICLEKESTEKLNTMASTVSNAIKSSTVLSLAAKAANLYSGGIIDLSEPPANFKCDVPLKIIVIAAGGGGLLLLIIIIIIVCCCCCRKKNKDITAVQAENIQQVSYAN